MQYSRTAVKAGKDNEPDDSLIQTSRFRAKHKNSHTGCLTCKQRRLKCDEQKPVCRRCQTAARECRPDPRRTKLARSTTDPSFSTALSPIHPLDIPEYTKQCLDYFISVTLSAFNRSEPSQLWDYLRRELPYSSSIRCMAIALGHEHRAATGSGAFKVPQASLFYIQAVQSLRQAIADLEVNKPPDMMFTIVCHCLLLVILQCFRKSFDELNIHLQHGLRIASEALKDYHVSTAVPLKESFDLLKRYSTAVALFNPLLPQDAIYSGAATATANQALSNPDNLKTTSGRSTLTTDDQSLRDAEQDLLLDLIRITITNRKPRMDGLCVGDLTFAEPTVTKAYLKETVTELRAKHAKLEQAIQKRTRSDNPTRVQRFQVAEARCMLLGIYLRCRWSGYMCNYDVEHDVFRRVVDKIQNSLEPTSSSPSPDHTRHGPATDSGSSILSIGLGTVAPLFYVVGMCRNAEIRTRAVELLSKYPQQDGPWSYKLARDMCRAFIAYEERKAQEECGDDAYDLTSYIPEHCRIAHYYYYTREDAVSGARREYVRVFRRRSGDRNVYVHEDLDLNSFGTDALRT